jgi:hypothetical protein
LIFLVDTLAKGNPVFFMQGTFTRFCTSVI